ncbi:MAG: pyridine nucleotide transhydrogenase [Nitrospirota bacterium]
MTVSLIGDTGFVGGNLLRQAPISDRYNSRTIETVAGRRFDLLIIAGAPGAKWRANRDPDVDAEAIARLTAALDRASARCVVLISTVDVYPHPVDVAESSAFVPAAACAYGRHRSALEAFVTSRFNAVVLRLPGVFGDGLKKNVMFDLLNRHQLDRINPDSVYQWYPLDRLWLDARLALARRLRLVNLVTEPIRVADLAREVFGLDLAGSAFSTPTARYNVRTEFDRALGGRNGYLTNRAETLHRLTRFVARARAGA